MAKAATPVIIFYILYFFWLFTVTYLTPEVAILNYFTLAVTLFYFVFLREKGDILWFWLSAMIPVFITTFSFNNWQPKFDFGLIAYMPLWLPLAWGTTTVALRKFYLTTASQ